MKFGKNIKPEDLNHFSKGSLAEILEMEVVEIGDDWLIMRMPVTWKTKQPLGLLHGGASLALAENVGSLAANLMAGEGKACLGLEINGNHIRSVSEGYVYAKASPLHIGKRTQVWEIKISDEQNQLVCISRLTMAVVNRENNR
jgi:1,4-dihydroxy-2-naphthoyl-CoA hydrolase